MEFYPCCAFPCDCAFQNKPKISNVITASVIINLFRYYLFHLTHNPSFKKRAYINENKK